MQGKKKHNEKFTQSVQTVKERVSFKYKRTSPFFIRLQSYMSGISSCQRRRATAGDIQIGEKGIMEQSPLATQRHRDYF